MRFHHSNGGEGFRQRSEFTPGPKERALMDRVNPGGRWGAVAIGTAHVALWPRGTRLSRVGRGWSEDGTLEYEGLQLPRRATIEVHMQLISKDRNPFFLVTL